jgi:trk system potassium uptake protein TrkH
MMFARDEDDASWRRRLPWSATSGVLLAASGVPVAAAQWAHGSGALYSPELLIAVVASACALALGGALLPRQGELGRYVASAGTLGVLALAVPFLRTSPPYALVASLVATWILAVLWNIGGTGVATRGRVLPSQARGASTAALLLWLSLTLARRAAAPEEAFAVTFALCVAAGLTLCWAVRERRRHPHRALAVAIAAIAAAGLGGMRAGDAPAWLDAGALLAATAAIALPGRGAATLGDAAGWWEPLLGHPERLFAGTFAGLCASGALVLALPYSATTPGGIALWDAAFTAVSAVCVTGLTVFDPASQLSAFGQASVLVMIQLGGLGIMTFSTAALRVLGRRMSLRHEGAVASLVSPRDRGQLYGAVRRVLVVTFAAEALGTLALLGCFLARGEALGSALWRALFTSVSAFCNAGFALQSDSLIAYQRDPLVLHTVAALIILGGLAPAAIAALPRLVRRSVTPLPVQVSLSLAAAAILTVSGFVLILAFEWSNTLAGLPIADRLHNAWFQSVTLRTAGFNSIDIAAVRPTTLYLMLVWMFIGGSPGGTAGGIKTTTAAVLILGVVAAVRGRPDITVFRRRLTARTVQKATVTATLGAATVLAAIVGLQLTQAIDPRAVVFEVLSATGTVGLTIGATASLDPVGKLIIMLCMFAGRVGPLTVLMFLSYRQTAPAIRRPEEDVDVG